MVTAMMCRDGVAQANPGADIRQHDPGYGLARLQGHGGVANTDRRKFWPLAQLPYGQGSGRYVNIIDR
jgi:hypothetical protein